MSTKNTVVTLLCLATIALTGCESMKPKYKQAWRPDCHSRNPATCAYLVPFDTPLDKNGYEITNNNSNPNTKRCDVVTKENGYELKNCQ